MGMTVATYVDMDRIGIAGVPYSTVSFEGVIIKIITHGACGSDL